MKMICDTAGEHDPKQLSIQRYIERKKKSPPELSGSNEDPVVLLARFSEAMGSVSGDFQALLLEQIAGLNPSGVESEVFLNSALALLYGLQPENEIEGLLGVQLLALHTLAMQMMRRACLGTNQKWIDGDTNRSDKLLRSFRETLVTLQKIRGKGSSQQVRVEHVHVHEGGQAVVGAVNRGGGEGRK